VAAFEIMLTTPGIQALIRENKTFRITSELQTGAKFGMNTLDSHLVELYERKIISYGEMITKAQDPQGIIQKMEGARGRK
jgi:twitching motility protein PilT